jgi:hypothetical protein
MRIRILVACSFFLFACTNGQFTNAMSSCHDKRRNMTQTLQ